MQPQPHPQQQQATPEQQPSPYPHFDVTTDGLSLFHREAGRLLHQAMEQGQLIAKLRAASGRLLASTEAVRADHGPDKCRPLEQTNGHAPQTIRPAAGRKEG